MPEVPLRRCAACRQDFPATPEFFHHAPLCKYGLATLCKTCACAKSRAWQAENKERSRRQSADYRAAHLEELRQYDRERWPQRREAAASVKRERYAADPEPFKAQAHRWRSENKERHLAGVRRWKAEHQERAKLLARAGRARRRARAAESGGTYGAGDVLAQYDRQRGRCFWCKSRVGETYHVDHVIPISKGGSNGPENIVVSCRACNLKKAAQHPMDFAGRLC